MRITQQKQKFFNSLEWNENYNVSYGQTQTLKNELIQG